MAQKKYNITKENAAEFGRKGKRGPAPEKKLLSDAIKDKITYEEAAALLVELAEKGNIKAIEMLLDRTAGKPVTEIEASIDVTEFVDKPLNTRFKEEE